MPRLRITDDRLILHLNPLEKFGALSRDVQVPLSAVRRVKVVQKPMPKWLKGLKVSDHDRTSPLKIFVLKKFKFQDGGRKAMVAVYLNRPALVIDLADPALRRIVVTHKDPEVVADAIRAAASL